MRRKGLDDTADYAESVAHYWADQVNAWTLVEDGELIPDLPHYYERIHPAEVFPDDRVHRDLVLLANQASSSSEWR